MSDYYVIVTHGPYPRIGLAQNKVWDLEAEAREARDDVTVRIKHAAD